MAPAEPELVELEEMPTDEERGRALSAALAYRAAVDADFRAGLEEWVSRAERVRTEGTEVNNTISWGTFHGPVVQGNKFPGITFGAPSASSPREGVGPGPFLPPGSRSPRGRSGRRSG